MGGIFISYRRADGGPFVGRLRDTLSNHFGADQVFRDINTIKPGERFPVIVERAIQTCNAVLVVIGPTWLTVTDSSGRRRLDNPSDLVRQEVTTALARSGLLVIPILVDTTPMPTADELPEPLASLAYCNAVHIADDVWDYKIAELTRALEKVQRPVGPLALQDSSPQALASRGLVSSPPVAGTGMATPQRELAAGKLVESVRVQWEEEAKIRGLFDPDPMPVEWTLTEHDVSDQSRHISPGPLIMEGSSDRIDELTEQFLTLSRRRLVILGAPGSGKTTLAVQLLLRLLEIRAPADPIPVLLTANGWNTTTHPRLQDWLAFRLGKDYPALRAIAEAMPRELVDNGMVLPVIDGLDELDPDYRPALLGTLNASLGATDPLVLTCRTDEYVDAVDNADVLTAAAVIEARPLTARDAAEYLHSCLPPRQRQGWDPILDTLRRDDDTPVADVCSTPLGLWLLRTVHVENKSDPTPLVDPAHYPDAASISAHLFDELIPALIAKRRPLRDGSDPMRPRRDWPADAMRRGLAYLAVQEDGRRDLRWWQLPSAVPSPVLLTLMALMGVVVPSIVIGLGLGLGLTAVEPSSGFATSLLLVLAIGLGTGLASVVAVVPTFMILVGPKVRKTPEPGYTNVRLRGRGRELAKTLGEGLIGGVAIGLPAGTTIGPTLALMDWLDSRNLMGWANIGVIVGSVGALVFARVRHVRSPRSSDRSWTPALFRRSLRNYFIVSVLLVGALLVVATVLGPARVPLQLLRGMLRFGLLGAGSGLAVGLAIGLARWVRSPGSNDRSRTPISTYRGSRNVMALSALLFPMMGVLLGFSVATVLAGLHMQLSSGRAGDLALGVVLGLWIGLMVGPMQEPAWLGFVGAARWLAFRGKLPWRTMGFLDDAHRLGLLRTVGSVYQFRHAELQDHLARSRGDRGTSPTDMTGDAEGSKLFVNDPRSDSRT